MYSPFFTPSPVLYRVPHLVSTTFENFQQSL